MPKNIPKFITMSFILTFIVSGFMPLQSANATDRSFWQKRQKPIKATFQQAIALFKIKIPEEYGTITDSYRGSNGRLIVHIQDAHANYEGQMNLANILESLIKDYGLKLILVEGGSTDSDFTYLRQLASLEERKEKAQKLLKDGIITGEEYLNIASDYPMSFQGIEDRGIYDAHLGALWELDRFKDVAGEYVDKLIAAAEHLKPHIYSNALLAIDKAKNDYENGKTSLISYYEYLYNKGVACGVPINSEFPDFDRLVKVSELEKKVNLKKIQEGAATKEEIELYKEYAEASKNLDTHKLFKEGSLLENLLMEKSAINPDQKTLVKISKALYIMKNLLNIKASPDEYAYFLANNKDFDPKVWAAFLEEKAAFHGLSLKIPKNFYIIETNLKKVKEFYRLAEERDKVFLEQTELRVKNDGVEIAALITGGFHTPRLTKLLAGGGYSYIVVAPKIANEVDETFYRSTLRRQWLSE